MSEAEKLLADIEIRRVDTIVGGIRSVSQLKFANGTWYLSISLHIEVERPPRADYAAGVTDQNRWSDVTKGRTE